MDLKDKWRNLLRVAMLPGLYKRRDVNGVPSELRAGSRVSVEEYHRTAAAFKDNGVHDGAGRMPQTPT